MNLMINLVSSVFDINALTQRISSVLDPDTEEPISVEDPIYKEPRDNPFLRKVNRTRRLRHATVKYSLVQERERLFIRGATKEVRIGYVFVEEGEYPATGVVEEESYTSLFFRLKDALNLKGGRELIPCTIKLHSLLILGRLADNTQRENYAKRTGVDIDGLIPTEWFFKRGLYTPK